LPVKCKSADEPITSKPKRATCRGVRRKEKERGRGRERRKGKEEGEGGKGDPYRCNQGDNPFRASH